MGYENHPNTRSSGHLLVVIFVVTFVLGIAAALGCGYLFLRTSRMQQLAMMQQERALVAEMRAREMRELAAEQRALSEAAKRFATPSSTFRMVTICVDKEGQVEIDGKPMSKEALRGSLQTSNGDKRSPTVVVKADHQCLFGHVAVVLDICKQLGIADVRVESLKQPTDSNGSSSAGSDDER